MSQRLNYNKLKDKTNKYKTKESELKEKVIVINCFPDLRINGLINWAKDKNKYRKETEPGYLEVRSIQSKFYVTFQVKEKLVEWCEVKLNN